MSMMQSKTAAAAVLSSLVTLGAAQAPGTQQTETHPPLTWSQCTAPGSCTEVQGSIVIDANWRWTHYAGEGNYTNCYTGNEWSCGDSATCTESCVIEGANYAETYGVTTSGNALTMAFVTENSSGTNVGARVYLLENDDTYQTFVPNGNEIAFDVENAEIGCGLNGAIYFIEMDEDGGMARYDTNTAGAAYGTGYCDSQCARDLKWVGGVANSDGWEGSDANSGTGDLGACCVEMDLWEANSMSFALTPHPCEVSGYFVCETTDCGGTYSDDRYAGQCDPDGCDLNPFRHGNTDFYGPGGTVDTTQKFTVVTQFSASGDTISQYFIQGGTKIEVPASTYVDGGSEITEDFCVASKELFKDSDKFFDVGGYAQMAAQNSNPMVLALSLWDDAYANMLWLDGVRYPLERDPAEPGVPRGTCAVDGSTPDIVREKFAGASVTYSNIKFGPIGSTY